MIPIRDQQISGRKPYVTYALIIVNILVFGYMMFLPESAIESFVSTWALTPSHIVSGSGLYTFITCMFLHGSLGHVVGNMYFLHIFGDNLEDVLGHFKYLLFYLLCGIVASIAQILVDPTSTIPTLGASGAIAGIMGGYLALFPDHRIDVLFEIGPTLKRGSVSAWVMLVYWFGAQMFNGVGSLTGTPDLAGVAYFAHIGGFVFGFGAFKILKDRIRKKQERYPRVLFY